TVSVAISGGSAGTGGAAAGGAGTGLAATGSSNDQLLWLWVSGGALAFVGGGVLVASAVRKQRKLGA
ncbi:MAG: peptidase, partial [Actinobacteria bacterium]|nr:peptidase [Actinomycetota bacterium]